jgi:surface polysaccharide O-acyltransferase-like enzyme
MERKSWIENARAIAIFLVVFTHCHERTPGSVVLSESIFYAIDRLGVPIFFMISGGLILPKLANRGILEFYKKRIPQFVLSLIIFCVITNSVMMICSGRGIYESFIFSVTEYNGVLNSQNSLGQYGGARQMWFLYSIIGLYLISPFLSAMVSNLSTGKIILFISLCILLNQLPANLKLMGFDIQFLKRLGAEMTGPYIAYFLSGYLIIARGVFDSFSLKKMNAVATLLVAIPSIALIAWDLHVGKVVWHLHWYSMSVPIFISSIGSIMLIKNNFVNHNGFMSFIGRISFGIFLVHYAVIYVASLLLRQFELGGYISGSILLFSLTFIASCAICWTLMKNRFSRWLIS